MLTKLLRARYQKATLGLYCCASRSLRTNSPAVLQHCCTLEMPQRRHSLSVVNDELPLPEGLSVAKDPDAAIELCEASMSVQEYRFLIESKLQGSC
jgi:hypothetical protein